ncbi:MAG: glucose-6-phosphate isomerase [Betaproteobacteria bacterium]|nr:glucose-6-phosphate isomerase [Betaproteobacteria bacterium]
MTRPTTTAAWQTLQALATTPRAPSVIEPLAVAGLYADFSRQSVDSPVLEALLALAETMALPQRREALFSGALVNVSEQRPALHTALRAAPDKSLFLNGENITLFVQAQLERVAAFSASIRNGRRRSASGQAFTDVVNIGIGGSLLGPEMVCAALPRQSGDPRVHFVANVDGTHLEDVLVDLNPATTLFTVTSKTFTTDETMTNARSAQRWLASRMGEDAIAAHFVAITANPAEARRCGYQEDALFEFRDWVGGRFSLWSTVGLPIALARGYATFEQVLAGAEAMDTHFATAPLARNLPVLLALVGIWNRNFLGMSAHAVLPYAQRLSLLPKHLQQLEMESNGKSVDIEGNPIDYATCPVLFGEAGTNGQHSFHQLLHQGSDCISNDIVVVAKPGSSLPEHHAKLLANAIAQADALWQGRAHTESHRVHPGKRPVTVLGLITLDAHHLGALIALYEHKVFVQGVLWNINCFDQWGVELGKTIAKSLLPQMTDADTAPLPHLHHLLVWLRESNART